MMTGHPYRRGLNQGRKIVHRKIVGHYCVEARCTRTPEGAFKSAYIVEPVNSRGPSDFVMISLLDIFREERSAIDAAMQRGEAHAGWLNAARTHAVSP
jgi:hypothetical protein